jgi:undecaprenyl-diphosphatase
VDWELRLVEALNGLAGRSAAFDWLVHQVAEGFLWLVPLLAVVALWVWQRRAQAAWAVLACGIGVAIADFLGGRLKYVFERPRPCHVLDAWQSVVGCGNAFSMPSNHMINSTFVAAFVQVLFPKAGWVLWPIVAFNGFGRMYTAAHYPTDLVVGTLIGAVLGVGSAHLFRRWWRVRTDRTPASAEAAQA